MLSNRISATISRVSFRGVFPAAAYARTASVRGTIVCATVVVLGCAGCDDTTRHAWDRSETAGLSEAQSMQATSAPEPSQRRPIGIQAIVAPALAVAATATAAMNIPQSHPRLWYSTAVGTPGAARLSRARAWLNAGNAVPITSTSVSASAHYRDRALRSLLNNHSDPADCAAAVNWLKGFTFNVGGTASDQARWDGENAILIYDWCHHAIAAADRTTLIARWNNYVSTLNGKIWGASHMAANNYFWGYLRNGLLWGIATAQENAQAQGFIDHALDLRYRNFANGSAPQSAFWRWDAKFGSGGVVLEGGQYGPYMLGYPVVAFTSATDYGYDAWNAVSFWRDAVFNLHYAAVPGKTVKRDGATARWELFPFNDDQFFVEGGSAENGEYGDFLGAMMLRSPNSAHARVARDWIARTGAKPSWWVRAELATLNVSGAAPALPLDYHATGADFFYGRRSVDPNTTTFLLQLGGSNAYAGTTQETFDQGGVGHSHSDAGSFQLWRGERWLSRETTGYSSPDNVIGWNNTPAVDPREAVAHNALLFEGKGQITGSLQSLPRVLRLQSAQGFAYAAVDLTGAYRTTVNQTWEAEDDWPFAEIAIREFIYLRALDVLVVLDRAQSGNDSLGAIYAGYGGPRLSAEQVRKSFILHATGTGSNEAGNPFTLSTAQATAIVGDQRLDLRTLLPSAPAYRVIKEGGDVGQYRLEYDVVGSAQSYLLNVVGMRGANDVAVGATLQDLGNSWRIELSHPVKGTALLSLHKGATSSGGSIRIGGGPEQPLRGDIQPMSIGDNGPVWPSARITGGNMQPMQTAASAVHSVAEARTSPVATGSGIDRYRQSRRDRR
jgi:hypothetical protein